MNERNVNVIKFDKFHRVFESNGHRFVEVELETGEHHSTNKAAAAKYVRAALGEDWTAGKFLHQSECRRSDGYPATWRKYAAVKAR